KDAVHRRADQTRTDSFGWCRCRGHSFRKLIHIRRPVEAVRPPGRKAPSVAAAVLAPVTDRRRLVSDPRRRQIRIGLYIPSPVKTWRRLRQTRDGSVPEAPSFPAAVLTPVTDGRLLVGDSGGAEIRIASDIPAPVEIGGRSRRQGARDASDSRPDSTANSLPGGERVGLRSRRRGHL